MSEQNYRFFGMVDLLTGEARLVFDQKRDAILAGYILCGDDGEFVPGNAIFEMDSEDCSSRDGIPHGCAVDHVWEMEVVDVAGVSSDFLATFFAGNRLSDLVVFFRHGSMPAVF